MSASDDAWPAPALSTSNRDAVTWYRRGVVALVADVPHAVDLLGAAVSADPAFHLGRIGVAVARVAAGLAYEAPAPTTVLTRAERQHAEIVTTAFAGAHHHAADLRREHLLEFPGDLLIVWLPTLLPAPRPQTGLRPGSAAERSLEP
jgi:hypothetical protein